MTAVELLPAGEAVHGNERWMEMRRQGVTASEIAQVMGISKWGSPFSLYWQKVNGWQGEDNDIAAAGRHLEGPVADWWAAENPGRVVHSAGLYCHAERRWQLATPDRFVCDPQWHDDPFPANPRFDYEHLTDAAIEALLECKWVAYSWDGWGEPGTDQLPVHYRAQGLWQMDVMGVDTVYFVALGPGGFRVYVLHRDEAAEADLEVMRKAGEDFVRRLAEQDPPDLDSHSATLGALKRLYPGVGEGDVEVPGQLAVDYSVARMKRKEAEESLARCEAEIRAALGSAYGRAIWDGRTVASRSVFETSRIDAKRLRAEQPDIAAAYMTTTTVDKLTPGRAK